MSLRKIDKNMIDDTFIQEVEEITQQLADKAELEIDRLITSSNKTNASSLNVSSTIKPTLTFIDDDGRSNLYSVLFPYARDNNVPITSGLITSRIGDVSSQFVEEHQVLEMRDSGLIEFVNHTATHADFTTLTDAQIIDEVTIAQKYLYERGIFTKHLIYPYGTFQSRYYRLLSKYIDSACISVDVDNTTETLPNSQVLNSIALPRITFEKDISILKQKIDNIKGNNGWLIINIHAQYPTFEISKLNEIVVYARSKGVDIQNVTEAFNNFKNIMEVRSDSGTLTKGISATGLSVGINDLQLSEPLVKEYHVDDSYLKYPQNKITSFTMLGGDGQRLGWETGGTVYTSRRGSEYHTHQIFDVMQTNRRKTRYWNVPLNKWSPWRELEGVLGKDILTAESNISEFPLGVSYSQLSNTKSVGTPTGAGGTLVTYKIGIDTVYNWQEFILANGFGKYIRGITPTGAPRSWIAVTTT